MSENPGENTKGRKEKQKSHSQGNDYRETERGR